MIKRKEWFERRRALRSTHNFPHDGVRMLDVVRRGLFQSGKLQNNENSIDVYESNW